MTSDKLIPESVVREVHRANNACQDNEEGKTPEEQAVAEQWMYSLDRVIKALLEAAPQPDTAVVEDQMVSDTPPTLREALEELRDLMQGVIDGEYTPDSFTLQVAERALAAHQPDTGKPFACCCEDEDGVYEFEESLIWMEKYPNKYFPLYRHPPPQPDAVPNEHGKNRYGLDMAYFRNLFNRELNRPLIDYRPDELARVLARAARTADASVLQESEFQAARAQPDTLGGPQGWELHRVEDEVTTISIHRKSDGAWCGGGIKDSDNGSQALRYEFLSALLDQEK